MSDNKKKVTDDYMAGLSGGDAYIKAPSGKPIPKAAKINLDDYQAKPKEEVKAKPLPSESKIVTPKVPENKPEIPKIVVPKFIKKDSELEKEIVKVIQEIPKEELEKILKPGKAQKEKLLQMDFQNRDDMSQEEKKDFIEMIAKREPEPEVAQMNGALVWKWQKNRKGQ